MLVLDVMVCICVAASSVYHITIVPVGTYFLSFCAFV